MRPRSVVNTSQKISVRYGHGSAHVQADCGFLVKAVVAGDVDRVRLASRLMAVTAPSADHNTVPSHRSFTAGLIRRT